MDFVGNNTILLLHTYYLPLISEQDIYDCHAGASPAKTNKMVRGLESTINEEELGKPAFLSRPNRR